MPKETQADTLQKIDLPATVNQFPLPKNVKMSSTDAKPGEELKNYQLNPGEEKEFTIIEGNAKDCRYTSEFNKQHIFKTKVKVETVPQEIKDVPSQEKKINGKSIKLPKEAILEVADKLLFAQVLAAGNSDKQKIHIQTQPTDEFKKSLIDALVLLCEHHGLKYQNDVADQYPAFNGAVPVEAKEYIKDFIQGKSSTMNTPEKYDSAAENKRIQNNITQLKDQAKEQNASPDLLRKIDKIQALYNDGLQKKGYVDAKKITKLLDELHEGLEESKNTPVSPKSGLS